jgi:hypothetical protein
MKIVYIPLAQVICQGNLKEKAFSDSLGCKSRCRTLDECNHFAVILKRKKKSHDLFESAFFAYVYYRIPEAPNA